MNCGGLPVLLSRLPGVREGAAVGIFVNRDASTSAQHSKQILDAGF